MLLALALSLTGNQTLLATDAARVRLRVVDRDTQAPVRDASVRWITAESASGLAGSWPWLTAAEELLCDAPVRACTDEEGWFDLPDLATITAFAAAEGRRFGAGLAAQHFYVLPHSGAGLASWPLELERDFEVDVRVLDAQGQPAPGVPVVLRTAADLPPVFTDASGHARFAHAGWALRGPGGGSPRARVAVGSPLRSSVEQPIDLERPPERALELRLPPVGEVELAFEELDGTPIALDGFVALQPGGPTQYGGDRSPLDGSSQTVDIGTELVRGEGRSSVVFACVGLDASLVAWVQRHPEAPAVRRWIRGPAREGERLRVVLRPEPRTSVLRGRILDARGRGRAGVWLTVQAFARRRSDAGGEGASGGGGARMVTLGEHSRPPCFRTDGQGFFRVECSWPAEALAADELELALVEAQGLPDERSVLLRLEPARREGMHELGELRLVDAPVVAAGRAVDGQGHPLEGVWVSITCACLRFALARSAFDGSFVLRGCEPCGAFGVLAEREGLEPCEQDEVENGTATLELVLPRARVPR